LFFAKQHFCCPIPNIIEVADLPERAKAANNSAALMMTVIYPKSLTMRVGGNRTKPQEHSYTM
jgi:hypothetical protein